MRTEQEMFSLIISTAEADERIRAVFMNGSRTNKNADRDIFQDYDIVYVVTETGTFREDRAWIDRFGERLYMQYPEDSGGSSTDVENCYGWLIQFADGNRLDLHVETLPYALRVMEEDRLLKVLYDKEGCLPPAGEATDEDYRVKRPSEQEFLNVCNEFWWCLNNVAKGLWRKEVLYVQDMVNFYVRPQLITQLSWKAGIPSDFTICVGKSAKYLQRFLSAREYDRLIGTYVSGRIEDMWDAAITMCGLFDETAREVADSLGFQYDQEEAEASFSHFLHVRELPADAKEIYSRRQ